MSLLCCVCVKLVLFVLLYRDFIFIIFPKLRDIPTCKEHFKLTLCLKCFLVSLPCLLVIALEMFRVRVVNGQELYLCYAQLVQVVIKGVLWKSPYEVACVCNDSASVNCDAVSTDFFFLIISESVSVLTDFLSKKKAAKSMLFIAPNTIAAHWLGS